MVVIDIFGKGCDIEDYRCRHCYPNVCFIGCQCFSDLFILDNIIIFSFFTRYDIRNHFDDKSQFGFKPNLPPRKTEQEKELELLLDEERYRFLGTDVLEEDLERGKHTT